MSRRIAFPLLFVSLIAGSAGCFALFPLEELGEGTPDAATVDAGHDAGRDAGTPNDAGDAEAGVPGRLIFVTSETFDGAFGGAAAADLVCNTLAKNAGRSGTFLAFLSDGSVKANDRFTAAAEEGRPGLVDSLDRTVAASAQALLNDGPEIPIDRTETGEQVIVSASNPCVSTNPSGALGVVWTGANENGGHGNSCAGFRTNATSQNGTVGNPLMTSSQWLVASCQISCEKRARFYCVER